ncbi:hypothetical protein BHE74_00030849 [Ensete ventricosum]|nr:hypothetical protein BHE74_00030849 [Ensete ventricosum]RZS02527.1 hypothetical protein BHM03_00032587 [Ensete ventricosum]
MATTKEAIAWGAAAAARWHGRKGEMATTKKAATWGAAKDDDDDGDSSDDKGSDYGITAGTPRIAALISIDRTPQDSIVDGDGKWGINDHFEGIGPLRSLRGDLPPRVFAYCKGATTINSYGGDLLHENPRGTTEPRSTQNKGHFPISQAEAFNPLYCHPSPYTKKLTRDELRERSAKGFCWHCDELWSREHRCKKGWLLVIEPVKDEDTEPSEESLEPEDEAAEEEPKSADYAVHALPRNKDLSEGPIAGTEEGDDPFGSRSRAGVGRRPERTPERGIGD